MKRAIPLLIAVVVLGAFAWTLVFLYRKSQAEPIVYQSETPFRTDIVKKTVATGAIVPRREIEMKSTVSGVVEEIHVVPGQHVAKDALLAKIRITPDVVSLNQAEGRVKAARISLADAENELKRNGPLYQKKLLAEAEYRRFQLDYELKRQELDAAVSNLDVIKEGSSRKSGVVSNIVRSTVEGMVLDVPIELGAQVTESNTFNAGTTVAFIADMNDMIFKGKVDESEVGKIKEGMALAIKIGALEDQGFEGKLEYIAPKGVKEEGAIQFEIRAAMVRKEGVFIRANYSANADIVLERREQVLAVRESLLQFDEGKPYVEVEVGPQQFERREIEVGLSDGINIEVKSGLGAEDKIKKPLEGQP